MNIKTSANWKLALALAAAAALSACGGGGSDKDDDEPPPPPPPRVTAVKVVGDSLSDSGTFGLKATIQASADEPDVLWVERIAKSYGLAPLCPVYKSDGTNLGPNPQAGCTNFAIGGGRINNALGAGGADAPLSVLRQLRDAAALGWKTTDLLVADGGGNDAADLVGAYLGAPNDQGAAYLRVLGTLLPAATLQAVLAGPNGLETAGGLYMQTLADRFAAGIRADGLDKGLQQALVADIPTITYTPRFQAVLTLVEQAGGPVARAQAEGLFKGWVNAFNRRLAEQFASEPRVKVMDVAARFTDQMLNPTKYGLSNVTLPACGAEWIPAAIVPHRDFATCTAAALTATPPPPGAPAGGGWWQHFLFSDGFHPTPYGHSLMGQQAIELLDQAGWR